MYVLYFYDRVINKVIVSEIGFETHRCLEFMKVQHQRKCFHIINFWNIVKIMFILFQRERNENVQQVKFKQIFLRTKSLKIEIPR